MMRDPKTKFPPSKIKRIMQSDKDVGKIAQATPVAVGKALELFMTQLVNEALVRLQQRNGKRLQLGHFNEAIRTSEQFDFLVEIADKYPDPQSQLQSLPPQGQVESNSLLDQ